MLRKIKNTTITIFLSVSIVLLMHSFGVGGYDYKENVDYESFLGEEIEEAESVSVTEEVIINTGIGTGEFIKPLDGTFTSGYGQRWGRLHRGIDIASEIGTPIKASDDATVLFTGECGTYGLLVKLDHSNGYVTYYAHCSKINVNVGDVVSKGDIIALVGNTGNSTGPHCHFEIRYDNVPKNPLDYIEL